MAVGQQHPRRPTGLEFAPLAAAETGADIAATQAALASWFAPLATAGLTFGVGVLYVVKGIADSHLLSPRLTALVATALVVMAVSRVLPFAAAQFYIQSAAGIVALWPLAHHMWRQPELRPAAGTPHPARTTAAKPRRRLRHRAIEPPGLP